ncbi:MAG TPA: hypothetical protein VKQ71_02745 [Acidimicrobiales bacterium]|nr:hypothetical protein [Acidimicrobiales bacterium]
MIGGRVLVAVGGLFAFNVFPIAAGGGLAAQTASSQPMHINCEYSRLCPDLASPQDVYDQYVGHDEPSDLFYSSTPGSGNQMQYNVTLPKDPPPSHPLSRSYNFELNGALWFGMALCDTQSYPEQVSTCTPDSDSNIFTSTDPTSPNFIGRHPGTAFLELHFYPPGWIPWPTWAVAVGADTCDPVRWCAAMNVFSLLEDPINGTAQNPACAAKIGIETFEFAFVTKNGVAQAPANPLDATLATFTPDRTKDLFMAGGDHLQVALHDTANGVQANIDDLTSGQSGAMTASPANGFAQFQYDPTGTTCNAIPYPFHPMYSTSSPDTRVIWAAHSYNVAFSDEIGHFQFCNGAAVPATPFGLDSTGNPVVCPAGNTEGLASGHEPTEGAGEDDFCFPAAEALRYKVQGCTETNTGFDGASYQPLWPDGNTAVHPTPFQFTSPRTGIGYTQPYTQAAFEADLPRIESTCNRTTGSGCTLVPTTDDGAPAAFYPFFTTASVGGTCNWQFGNVIPGNTNNFGGNSEYGSLLPLTYLAFGGGGSTITRFNDFRGVISNNC